MAPPVIALNARTISCPLSRPLSRTRAFTWSRSPSTMRRTHASSSRSCKGGCPNLPDYATERRSAMTLKQNFVEQLKAQSDIWRAQAKDYQERLQQAGEQARAEYKKAMEQMEAKSQDAAKLPEQVRGANEAAWKDMVTASQKAFAELQRGWAEAVSRFQ